MLHSLRSIVVVVDVVAVVPTYIIFVLIDIFFSFAFVSVPLTACSPLLFAASIVSATAATSIQVTGLSMSNIRRRGLDVRPTATTTTTESPSSKRKKWDVLLYFLFDQTKSLSKTQDD